MKINDISTTKAVFHKEREVKEDKNVHRRQISDEATKAVKDQIEISFTTTIEQAQRDTKNMPDIREERVREIQEKIKEGAYQVSNRDIARAMISTLLSEIA